MSPTQEKTYKSSEVAQLANVSLRQLQWWDERKIIRPIHLRHARQYTTEQVLQCMIAADLRKRGLSMHLILLRVLPRLRSVKPQPNYYLVVSPSTGAVRCVDEIERSCDMSSEPVVVIRLNRLYEKLAQPVPVKERRPRVAVRALRGEGFTRVDMSAVR